MVSQALSIKVHLTEPKRPRSWLSFDCIWPSQSSEPLQKKKTWLIPLSLSDLSVLFPPFCQPISLTKYPSLEEVEFIRSQSFSQGAKEALIVGCVVDHEQDSRQQLIGHQQVVQVRPLVVPTAVATTPFYQGPEIILVPWEKFRKEQFKVKNVKC